MLLTGAQGLESTFMTSTCCRVSASGWIFFGTCQRCRSECTEAQSPGQSVDTTDAIVTLDLCSQTQSRSVIGAVLVQLTINQVQFQPFPLPRADYSDSYPWMARKKRPQHFVIFPSSNGDSRGPPAPWPNVLPLFSQTGVTATPNRAVVPNLLSTRDWFHGWQFLMDQGYGRGGLGMIQGHHIYCALYF